MCDCYDEEFEALSIEETESPLQLIPLLVVKKRK
jgi:hypothetical protein